MHKFIKDGETLGFSEQVRWIKKNEYGIYVQTEEESAEGVAFGGVAYNIPNGSFSELDTVAVKEVNGGRSYSCCRNASVGGRFSQSAYRCR